MTIKKPLKHINDLIDVFNDGITPEELLENPSLLNKYFSNTDDIMIASFSDDNNTTFSLKEYFMTLKKACEWVKNVSETFSVNLETAINILDKSEYYDFKTGEFIGEDRNVLKHNGIIYNTLMAIFFQKGQRTKQTKGAVADIKLFRKKFIEISNSNLYHAFRTAISSSDFSIKKGEKWPSADLSNINKTLIAHAELKPDTQKIGPIYNPTELEKWQNIMSENIQKMDDLTADILDIISAVWIKKARHYEEMIDLTVDDFLIYRSLIPKKNSEGRYGGYREKERREIQKRIEALDNTWITVSEMEIAEEVEGKKGKSKIRKWKGESKAIAVTSRFGQVRMDGTTDAYIWRLRPGDVFARFLFGPGKQTALLAQKALEYDPYRQKWEKRLTRYLTWLWRIRQQHGSYMEPFSVKKLIEAIKDKIDKRNPKRTRERLETALDKLEEDRVISQWQYDVSDYNEDIMNKRGWLNHWLTWKVWIEPPKEIIEQYNKIKNPKKNKPLTNTSIDYKLLRQTREDRGLTLSQAAEEIGISPSSLSRIERGTSKPGKTTAKKIKNWLQI